MSNRPIRRAIQSLRRQIEIHEQKIATQNIWQGVCQLLGLADSPGLPALHFSEMETEAENVLDLLTVLRTHTYQADGDGAQETAAELVIALEHLQHHVQALLPQLQQQLHLEP